MDLSKRRIRIEDAAREKHTDLGCHTSVILKRANQGLEKEGGKHKGPGRF